MKLFTHYLDLTYPINSGIPSWNQESSLCLKTILDYDKCTSSTQFRIQEITMPLGIGTHIDAPAHCIARSRTVDQLSLKELIVPAIVIDVSLHARQDYSVTKHDIQKFEAKHGRIESGRLVLIYTGWSKHWLVKGAYHNNYKFPCMSLAAAELLLERDIVGLGIDTLSPDRQESGFPVHSLLLGSDKYIIENIANLDQLPVIGSTVVVMPLPIEGATESPARVIAMW